jgi:hypothetical protein
VKYPRAACPVCNRDSAVTPRAGRIWRHDPPERDPELRSCAGSYALHQPGPGEYGYAGDQQSIFEL